MGHPSRVSLLGNAALFDYTNVLSVCDVISLFQQKARRVYMGFKNADLHVGVVSGVLSRSGGWSGDCLEHFYLE